MGRRKILKKNELPEKLTQLSTRVKDITGQKFDRLTVIFPSVLKANDGSILWVCHCDCGEDNYVLVTSSDLRRKNFHSCGSKEDKIFVQQEELNKRYIELNGKIFNQIKVLDFDYCENRRIYLRCECLNCGSIFTARKDSIITGHKTSCGCIRSKGEYSIGQILKNKSISFQKEYSFSDCCDIKPLRFDFALFDEQEKLIGLIEYQGIQHYQYDEDNSWNTEEHFNKLIEHDQLKKDYCKNNNISLYEIKYNENIEQRMEEILNVLYI